MTPAFRRKKKRWIWTFSRRSFYTTRRTGGKAIQLLTNERRTWCHLLFYFTYYVLNMLRTLIYPSSGACDCVDELPHRSSCSQFGFWWCSFCRLQPAKRTPSKTARTKSSNTQRTENKMTDVVIHQHSRKLLKMDILMSETCWAHKKWNKIASDIKFVFHSSTIAMLHGPINIRFTIELLFSAF